MRTHGLNVDRARRQLARHADEHTPAVPAFRPPVTLKVPVLRLSSEQASAAITSAGRVVAPYVKAMREMAEIVGQQQAHGARDLNASLTGMRQRVR